MQIQYNITRIEEWCKSHDMPEGTLQLEHLMQATKLLQLKKVCRALKRIRTGDIFAPTLEADLWTAFIMLTENDGKNYIQLEWIGLDRFAESVVVHRLWENRNLHHGWPAESTVNSLAIWILFMMLDAGACAMLS